jgi:hypothetical protein
MDFGLRDGANSGATPGAEGGRKAEGDGDGSGGGSSSSSRGATGSTLVAEKKALSQSQLRMLRC